MVTLNDGRDKLYQWDTGRILNVNVSCDEIHFSNPSCAFAFRSQVINDTCKIPDEALWRGTDLLCWCMIYDSEGRYVREEKVFKVHKRAKPQDYVYTPTDLEGYEYLNQKIGATEELLTNNKKDLVSAINELYKKAEEDIGGFYIPSVKDNGELSWRPSEKNMPPIEPVNIKGPQGESGVYVGEKPSEADKVWVKPDGKKDSLVKTINGQAPDENGNIDLTGQGTWKLLNESILEEDVMKLEITNFGSNVREIHFEFDFPVENIGFFIEFNNKLIFDGDKYLLNFENNQDKILWVYMKSIFPFICLYTKNEVVTAKSSSLNNFNSDFLPNDTIKHIVIYPKTQTFPKNTHIKVWGK